MRPILASALLPAVAVAATSMPLYAQEAPPPPPIAPLKPFQLPRSETYALSNGMKVTLLPYGTTPKVTVDLRVFAGTLNEAGTPWAAQMTAEMLKEGAGGLTSDQIADRAADMGGRISVGAGAQMTSVSTDVLSEKAAEAVALIGAIATRPTFPAAEWARVKANDARSLAVSLAQAPVQANVVLARTYYGDAHPYGTPMPTAAQLDGYGLDTVRSFYAANYGARRAHLYVAGRFDPVAVKAAVTRAFGGWASGPERLSRPAEPKPGMQVVLVDRPDAPQTTIRIAYPQSLAGSAAEPAQRVGDSLYSGSFSSRLTRNLREDKGYTYSPYSRVGYNPGDARYVWSADITTAQTGAAMREVFDELRRLQTAAPDAEETEGQKTYVSGIFVFRNATPQSVVGTLASAENLGLPDSWISGYIPTTQAVTAGQVQDWAKGLRADRMTLILVGDLKTVVPQLKALPELASADLRTVPAPQ